MYFGDYYPRLDEKGRLALPARFREQLGEEIVVARGQDRCLDVRSRADFEAWAEELRSDGSRTAREVREYERMLFSYADNPTQDRQGRILIKPELRRWAGLERDAAVVGANNRIEIWDAARWRQYVEETEQKFADFSGEVVPR